MEVEFVGSLCHNKGHTIPIHTKVKVYRPNFDRPAVIQYFAIHVY